ncbi:MAG: hypothetical protein AB8F34_16475 [Akkermansiaceae bacterium]
MMESRMPKCFRFLIITAMPVAFISCEKKSSSSEGAKKTDEVGKAINEVTDMYARQFEGEADLESDNDTLNRAIEVARKAEQSSTGQKAANHMVLRHWLTLMRDHNLEQAENTGLVQAATDYEKTNNIEDIDASSKKIHEAIKFNNRVIQKTKTAWMTQLRELAGAEGMDNKMVTKAVSDISNSFSSIKPDLFIVRQKDHEIYEEILKQHTILKNAFGKWKWDSEKSEPVFDEEATQKAFEQTHKAIGKAIDEQDAAQARILAIQQAAG